MTTPIVVRCDQRLPVVHNSGYEVRGRMLGEVTTYTCDEGYVTAENASDFNVTCQSDRTWSQSQSCERKYRLNTMSSIINYKISLSYARDVQN